MDTQTINDKIDELEFRMQDGVPIDCPVNHYFADGMYIREILMPAGSLVTSLIHRTTHPYFVMEGKVSVYSDNDGVQLIQAPFNGITLPDTRRVLYIHENCRWLTCHSTLIMPEGGTKEEIEKAVDLIGNVIIEKRENPLLGGTIINNVLTKTLSENY